MGQSVYPFRNYPEYPIQTTASRASTSGLAVGYTAYNQTSKKLEIWNGTLWYGFDGSLAQGVVPWAPDAFTFTGGNVSSTQIAAVGKSMANASAASTPTAGGTLTIDSQALGSYDYVIKSGDQTVSSFTNSDWFTTTADTRSAFVVVQGNLTINSGQTFIPSNRKLFTCIYVTGNLTLNGTISMSGRGANHSATTAAAIRIANGTYSSITNPSVPAAGGAAVGTSTNGNAGTNGGTGSGGGGQNDVAVAAPHGTAGTSFSGGTGGGGGRNHSGLSLSGTAGTANGGAGGNAIAAGGPYPTANPSSGGSGNPAGSGGENPGGTGTGGILFIIVEGTISGSGTITVNGVNPGSASERPGGGSGGGSCTVLYMTDTSTITPTATGGIGNGIYGATTNGGTGTARKLAIG